MKKLIIIATVLLTGLTVQAQSLDAFLDEADAFFKAQTVDGRVDYKGLNKNGASLKSLVDQVASMNTNSLSGVEKKAFYINAYNISVINGILKEYPTDSPLKIGGFFEGKKHTISGLSITLNTLEKEHLLKATGDEKLHFVLVCAAVSCPPIASFAYRPEKLDAQILERTKLALNNDEFVQVKAGKKTVELSEIFKWYPGDFKDKAPSIIQYLNKYRDEPIPTNYKTGYYTYDWTLNGQNAKSSKKDTETTSNLQNFTPSVLLRKGQVEFNSFYNIYTQNRIRNREGDKVSLDQRQSFFNAQYQVTFGVSKSSRLNLGFDVAVSSFSNGNSPFSPIFQSGDVNEVVLASIGPSIRFTPFKRLSNLSVRSAFWFPGGKDLENRNGAFVSHDRYTSVTQVFYDHEINAQWRLFLEADLIYRFARRDDQVDFFRTPVTGILSYFPSNKVSLFALYQYSPRFQQVSNGFDEQFGLSQWFQQAGLGFKVQLTDKLGIEASTTSFFASRNDGGGTTLNLGFRYIK